MEAACVKENCQQPLINIKRKRKILTELEKGGRDVAHNLAIINEFENAGLIIAAQKYFWALVKSNNDKTLAKTYAWFLLKYGFEDEAAKLWERSVFKKEITQSN